MNLETEPIAYDILVFGPVERLRVKGYAVNSPTGIRYCVRRLGIGKLRFDHYDTGLSMNGALSSEALSTESMPKAIRAMEKALPKLIKSGRYEAALKKAERQVKDALELKSAMS